MGGKKKEAKEKPLEKMTATELRELAKEIPDITGAHGMNKPELVTAIKQARGIEDTQKKKRRGSVREIKAKIQQLKKDRAAALEAQDARRAAIYKRKISRLKKKTRRAA
ncbi:MAG: Rho termination factor N-terminal domain-containing protein [Desulfobacterales bacterium]|nr:Rho termination factor N-terminal domain-containing protein [Desulfobacterales bacterium]